MHRFKEDPVFGSTRNLSSTFPPKRIFREYPPALAANWLCAQRCGFIASIGLPEEHGLDATALNSIVSCDELFFIGYFKSNEEIHFGFAITQMQP